MLIMNTCVDNYRLLCVKHMKLSFKQFSVSRNTLICKDNENNRFFAKIKCTLYSLWPKLNN